MHDASWCLAAHGGVRDRRNQLVLRECFHDLALDVDSVLHQDDRGALRERRPDQRGAIDSAHMLQRAKHVVRFASILLRGPNHLRRAE